MRREEAIALLELPREPLTLVTVDPPPLNKNDPLSD